MEQSSLPKPLVPFLQSLTHKTLMLEREKKNLVNTYSCKLYSIFNGKELSYEVEHLRINRVTGSKVQRHFQFSSFEKALQNLSV